MLSKVLLLFAQATLGGNDAITFDEQVRCAPAAYVAHALDMAGYEELTTEALNDKILFHLYVDKKGSWIMSLTNTLGLSCMLNSGENWYIPGKESKND